MPPVTGGAGAGPVADKRRHWSFDDLLYNAVRKHPHYQALQVEGRPESHITADIAERFWQIPRDRIVVEDRSTNCGENAWFTRRLLEERGLDHTSGVVIQDPTMQRRTMATFARVWQDAPAPPQWWSYRVVRRGSKIALLA